MVSGWRFMCCRCYGGDDERFSPYSGDINSGRRRKVKTPNGKATWTRRSLLDNEHQSEFIDLPTGDGPLDIPLRTITTNSDEDRLMREHERFLQQLENEKFRRRRPVFDLFDRTLDKIQNSKLEQVPKTTFPWMDDEFSASSRSTTHLGISSVKINAKRNELARRSPSGAQDLPTSPYSKEHPLYAKPHAPKSKNSHNTPTKISGPNMRTNPHSHATNVRKTNLGQQTQGIVSGRVSENIPHVYRAPTSQVGVRRISSGAPADRRFPKLGVHQETKSDICLRPNNGVTYKNGLVQNGVYRVKHNMNTGVKHGTWGQSDAHVNNLLQQRQGHLPNKENIQNIKNTAREITSDVSFSSEIKFRKANSDARYQEDATSMQRSKQPTMFTATQSNCENVSQIKAKKKENKKHCDSSHSGSMYEYVPKAVQNVQASIALGGYKIDDYLGTRMRDGELENFASMSQNRALVERPDMQKHGQAAIKVQHTQAATNITDDQKNGLKLVSSEAHSKMLHASDSIRDRDRCKDNVKPIVTNVTNGVLPGNKVNDIETHADVQNSTISETEDDDEEEVIMINFPPNILQPKKTNIIKTNDKEETNNKLKPGSLVLESHVTNIDQSEHSSLLGNIEVLY